MKSGTNWVIERTRNAEAKTVWVFLKKTSQKRALSDARRARDNEGTSKISHEGLKHTISTMKIKYIKYYIIGKSLACSVLISSLPPTFPLCFCPCSLLSRHFCRLAATLNDLLTYFDDSLRSYTMGAVCCRPQVCRPKSPLSKTYAALGFLAH